MSIHTANLCHESPKNNTIEFGQCIARYKRKINIPEEGWKFLTWSNDGEKIAYSTTTWKKIITLDKISNNNIDTIHTNKSYEFLWVMIFHKNS